LRRMGKIWVRLSNVSNDLFLSLIHSSNLNSVVRDLPQSSVSRKIVLGMPGRSLSLADRQLLLWHHASFNFARYRWCQNLSATGAVIGGCNRRQCVNNAAVSRKWFSSNSRNHHSLSCKTVIARDSLVPGKLLSFFCDIKSMRWIASLLGLHVPLHLIQHTAMIPGQK
jgi:hypothetical protein